MLARGEHVPLSSWREEGDDWQCQSAGPACCPLGQARLHSDRLHRGVSAGKRFSTSFLFYFLTFFLI